MTEHAALEIGRFFTIAQKRSTQSKRGKYEPEKAVFFGLVPDTSGCSGTSLSFVTKVNEMRAA
jgi:hypothetical protein